MAPEKAKAKGKSRSLVAALLVMTAFRLSGEQGLKPLWGASRVVAAKAATHKEKAVRRAKKSTSRTLGCQRRKRRDAKNKAPQQNKCCGA
jgi:hypothetical protein